MDNRLGGGRQLKKLAEHLTATETVELIAQGTYEKDQGVLVLTDQRLLFLFHGVTRQRVQDFPIAVISSVRTSVGVVFGDLVVHASGKGAVISNVVKSDLTRLADALRQRLARRGTGQPSAPAAPVAVDPVDQIRKLAELRDVGVLTEDEFDAISGTARSPVTRRASRCHRLLAGGTGRASAAPEACARSASSG